MNTDKPLAIIGLQRSGTNYLEALVNLNFKDVFWCQYGTLGTSKHKIEFDSAFKEALNPNAKLLIVYKNPYTWIESISNRNAVDYAQMQQKHGIARKATKENHTFGRNNMDLIQLSKTWNEWAQNWLVNTPLPAIKFKYEDLLIENSRNNILNLIGQYLEQENIPYLNPELGKIIYSSRMNEQMISYYLNMKPMSPDFTQKHLDLVNQYISDTSLNAAQYSRLNTLEK